MSKPSNATLPPCPISVMSVLPKRVIGRYRYRRKSGWPSMQGLSATLTRRMHQGPILCRRGNEIGHFPKKRSRVDTQNAQNSDFASTWQGAAASHNQARRLRLTATPGSVKGPASRRPSPTLFASLPRYTKKPSCEAELCVWGRSTECFSSRPSPGAPRTRSSVRSCSRDSDCPN